MSSKAAKPIALVLCGGAGTRMAPWSDARHKCLVSVDQECRPLFARHVERLRAHGFRVYANVGAPWADAFRDVARGMGAPVTVIPERGKPNGSGTTLLRLARENPRAPAIVTVCGDVWYPTEWYGCAGSIANLSRLSERPSRTTRDAWLFVARPNFSEGRRAPGKVRLSQDKHPMVLAIRESPTDIDRWPPDAVQAAGMTVWSRAMLAAAAKRFGSRRGIDMMRDILPRFLWPHGRTWVAKPTTGEPCDLGTPLRYARHVARQYEDHGRTQLGEDAAGGIIALLTARRILTAGNGGACAVAQHAAVDWQKAGGRDVMALADSVVGSAWANDYGYENGLARQVERVRDPGDAALVVFSASGASTNVINAVKRARELGYHAVVAVSRADSTAWVYRHATHPVKLPFGLPRSVREYGAIEDAMSAWVHAAAAVMAGLAPWRSCMAEGGA